MHQHTFEKSTQYPNYEVCTECGTFHSTALLPPDDVYVNSNYWDTGDGTTGRSTIEQQSENLSCTDDCGISKIDRVLQFVPKRGKNILEIGASPGKLMQRLVDLNWEVFGIEPRQEYCQYLTKLAPEAKVVKGYFPQVTESSAPNVFACVVAMDIAEHIDDHHSFFNEIHRLLIPNGTAIIMSPIIMNQDGFLRQRDMDFPSEHAWIWTERYLDEYLKSIFSSVEFRNWIVGHTIVICKK
jgi:2-polyprenyl-3-methyl-5-hydroxy-6-metoxy-1,4-benzoquinol methylase